MKLLLADSGSSKTEWRFIDDAREQHKIFTTGLNPWHISGEDFRKLIEEKIFPFCSGNNELKLFFYGAGCGNELKRNSWLIILERAFPHARVQVSTDLLGAARALCGKEKGFAAILGTGSNAGEYDGENICRSMPSPGFILGDEGGGVHIGKKILGKYLRHELSPVLQKKIEEECGKSEAEILDQVYHHPYPARFIASFSKIATTNSHYEECRNIIEESFINFLENFKKFSRGSKMKLSFTGSVAWHNRELLLPLLEKFSIAPGRIVASPMDGLVDFHLEK
ncbi:MAG: N-acetylglucosamine kinase [Bacteroidetes bacterium]|nr:N-acetylglucosamine kinase [Bacteroidota bacterium]